MPQNRAFGFDRATVKRDLLALLALSAATGLLGGAPLDHPDYVIKQGLETVANGGNPEFFHYPALLIYLHGVLYAMLYGALDVVGAVADTDEFVARYFDNALIDAPVRIPFFLPGHLVTVMFAWLGAAAVYLIARRLTAGRSPASSRRTGMIAGLFLCGSLLWSTNAHLITVDLPAAALAAAAVALLLRPVDRGRPLSRKHLLQAGAACGLAASAKYPNAAVLLSAFAFLAFHHLGSGAGTGARARVADLLRSSFAVGAVALAVFLAINPFVVLDFQTFWTDFRQELRHASVGHFGHQVEGGFAYHLTTTLAAGYGWLPLALAALGAGGALVGRAATPAQKAGLLVYPAIAYALIARSTLAFHRYMVPVLPFLAVLSAFGFEMLHARLVRLGERTRGRFGRPAGRLAAALVLALAVGPGLFAIARQGLVLMQPDTRRDLAAVLSGLADRAGPAEFDAVFADPVFTQGYVKRAGLAEVEQLYSHSDRGPFDLIVLDSFGYDRYLYDAERRSQGLPLEDAAGMSVLQITPFAAPKDRVPFAPESNYCPYPPDLWWRERPGPFLELYFPDRELAAVAARACRQRGIEHRVLEGTQGYYARRMRKP